MRIRFLTLDVKVAKRVGTLVSLCAILTTFLMVAGSSQQSTASFSSVAHRVVVQIDGKNYGAFEPVDLNTMAAKSLRGSKNKFHQIALQRHFVTDSSLYLWAKDLAGSHNELKDIHLVAENKDGAVIGSYVLKLSQPVSWTVESDKTMPAGFVEKVVVATQQIQRLE